jgi:hypothetical protein
MRNTEKHRHKKRPGSLPVIVIRHLYFTKIDYSSMDKYILEQINKQAVGKAKKQKVTKEHLKIAKENGIKETTVRSRVYYHGWDGVVLLKIDNKKRKRKST